jgi:hypothetical protein
MALLAAEDRITPKPVESIFADTQAEPKSVYRWLDWLEPQLPFPVVRVTAGNLETSTLELHVRRDGKGHYIHSGIPHYSRNADGSAGHGPRQCTHDFKIIPIQREQRRLVMDKLPAWKKLHRAAVKQLTLWRSAMRKARSDKLPLPPMPFEAYRECQDDALIVCWIGFSTDEADRQKDSRVDYVRNRYPLLEMGISREACDAWLKKRGFPAEFKRAPKSACVFCPYHSDEEWLWLKTKEPEEFERAVKFDREYRRLKVLTVRNKGFSPYLHDSRKPLDEVTFIRRHKQLSLFANECEGMCGL